MSDCWNIASRSMKPVTPCAEEQTFGDFRKVRRVTVLLDSRDRDYTKYSSASTYTVWLPSTLYNVTAATLKSAEFPTSYYVFTAAKGNTSLIVSVNGVSRTVTIPDGNYGFTSMAAALTSVLATAFPSAGLTVSFGDATAKCTITAASGSAALVVDCSGATELTQWGLGYYLGFPQATRSGTGSVTGSTIACMNPEVYLLLDIPQLNGVDQAGMYGDGPNTRVFAKLPVCHQTFQYNLYDKLLTTNEYTQPIAKLDRVDVAIRFHDGSLVDFQGAEHSLCLEIMCTQTR